MSVNLKLRQNLELIEADTNYPGASRWTLYDKVRNRFYRLEWKEIEILRFFKANKNHSIEDAALIISSKIKCSITTDDIESFNRFLENNTLLEINDEESRLRLQAQYEQQPTLKNILLNSYLFFKIPIINPDRLLNTLLPWTGWLFQRRTVITLLLVTIIGIYLSLRQWYELSSATSGLLTPQGIIAFFIALSIVKILHEVGHALAAKKAGCSVPSMGIAFMVFWPILYTDTTDAWRLENRSQRIWIGMAGIIVELSIALICLLLMPFLPEGTLKNICFLLATITWIMTLLVNLNPLMRFDGYFVFSDLWGIENLQERSFSQGRWWLRKQLFGSNEEAPEAPNTGMLLYCYAAWLYRLFIIVTIGLLIYHFFFKLLGLVLICFYLFTSFIKPITRELMYCYSHRENMKMKNSNVIVISILCLSIGLLFYPISSTMVSPAILQSGERAPIYAPMNGQITLMPSINKKVSKGETVFSVHSFDNQHQAMLASNEADSLTWQLRNTSIDSSGAPQSLSQLKKRLLSVNQKQQAIDAMIKQGEYQAPISGAITDINPGYMQDSWVAKGTPIATIIKQSNTKITAYVSEKDITRIKMGAQARFYADGGLTPPLEGTVTSIDNSAVTILEEPYVASIYGGEVPTHTSTNDSSVASLTPLTAQYRVLVELSQPAPERVIRGSMSIQATAESYFSRMKRHINSLWQRESGF